MRLLYTPLECISKFNLASWLLTFLYIEDLLELKEYYNHLCLTHGKCLLTLSYFISQQREEPSVPKSYYVNSKIEQY